MSHSSEPEIVHLFATFSRAFDHSVHGKLEKWKLATAPTTSGGQFWCIHQGVKVHLHEWKDPRIPGMSVDRGLSYKPPTWGGIIGDVGVIMQHDRQWVEFHIMHSQDTSSDTAAHIHLLVPLEWVRLGFFGWLKHVYLCIHYGGRNSVPITFAITPPAAAAIKAFRNREVQSLPAPVVFRRFSDLEAHMWEQDLSGAQTLAE